MAIILDLDKCKVESKWHEFKVKAKNAAVRTMNWIKENPELAAMGGAAIGFAGKGLKGLIRHANLRRDTYNKERFIYDRSLGMHLHTKRPLRNQDYVTINRRRANGEKLYKILTDMHLLD